MEELINKYKLILENSVSDFINKDIAILELDAHEQAISHRIAVYIEKRLEAISLSFNIDCEYNRNITNVKKLGIHLQTTFECCTNSGTCKSIKEAFENGVSLTEHQKKSFRPDIVIHTRGNNNHNEIVIEIKKDKQCPFDKIKLKEMTASSGDYKYKLGAFIHFPDNQPKIIWFVEGNETH